MTGQFGMEQVVSLHRNRWSGWTGIRIIAKYDKFGCRQIVKSIKYHYFGDRRIRMNKNRCEEFFENDRNFV